jgi:hypothetical protein
VTVARRTRAATPGDGHGARRATSAIVGVSPTPPDRVTLPWSSFPSDAASFISSLPVPEVPVPLLMAEHSSERQHEEQGQKQKMTAADQEHQRRKHEPIDGEAHQTDRAGG